MADGGHGRRRRRPTPPPRTWPCQGAALTRTGGSANAGLAGASAAPHRPIRGVTTSVDGAGDASGAFFIATEDSRYRSFAMAMKTSTRPAPRIGTQLQGGCSGREAVPIDKKSKPQRKAKEGKDGRCGEGPEEETHQESRATWASRRGEGANVPGAHERPGPLRARVQAPCHATGPTHAQVPPNGV